MKTLLKISGLGLFLAGLIFISSCDPQKQVAGNYAYKTECMGTEQDGTQTLKAWGNGRHYFDAAEQAKKNAVSDVLFKGISEGKTECEMKPILFEANAREKNEDYFNRFFADGGEFKNYVTLQDERIWTKLDRDRKGARKSATYSVIVRVLRPQLKAKMIADGILKLN